MAQFDVYRNRSRAGFVLDCQSNLLRELPTRLVAPLIPAADAPATLTRQARRLFRIEGDDYTLAAHLAAPVEVRLLGSPVATLRSERERVLAAFDLVLTGV